MYLSHDGLRQVQFSRSLVSDSLRPHELQHARPPCSSPSPGVHSDSCPLSPWCHPTISSSVVPFSSWPQSLPASESFPMSQLFSWGGQSTGVSALASVLPKNTQDWSPLEWTGWISLQSKSLCRLCPWVFPGKNTSVGCHILLQGIFQTQRWNPGLLHCRQILYCLDTRFLLLLLLSHSWFPLFCFFISDSFEYHTLWN